MWQFRLTVTLVSIFVLPNGTPAAALDKDLNDLMTHLAQQQRGHTSFIERQFIGILDRPIESSGELFYTAPNHLEKRTLRPKFESLILERNIISLKREKFSRSFSLKTYPQLGVLMTGILQTLSGDFSALNRTFSPSFESTTNGWQLALTPRDPKIAALISKVLLLGNEDEIHRIEVKRGNGDYSILILKLILDH